MTFCTSQAFYISLGLLTRTLPAPKAGDFGELTKMAPVTKLTGCWMEPRECVDTGVSIQILCPCQKLNHVKLITSHYNDRAIHCREWSS
jgi:hypothetical protein